MEQKSRVVIVGAGPAGLATSACLNLQNIANIVLEREDCAASLWRKRAYERLKLHLAKEFCQLPHMPFPSNSPTFIPRNAFIRYLDDYVARFGVSPLCCRSVVSASLQSGKWVVVARNGRSGATERYVAEFLVVATGENSEGFIPPLQGLHSFKGEVLHSSMYENGERFQEREVLVVGSGNSGMEIALDLANWGARTSVVIRSPVHVLSENLVRLGMTLLSYLPLNLVDNLVVFLGNMKHGNLSKYGIRRPKEGPFFLKMATGRSAVIDVGTIAKIKAGEIQVFPSIKMVEGNQVTFSDGRTQSFDAIVFATGYKSTVRTWLQDDEGGVFGEDGMPKEKPPNHWKGENGVYCAGFARAGLAGIAKDAKAISQDINAILSQPHTN
ncbi:probable indole-3-pyruvate monooxygenase YUCCA11 [Salvia miltiorrhiza]|uniref:probable indole-3-pyruvate monooxygenase YUCCA11 n=1 Tax=Salvia miltiorrhiza TaxID=226208 RepID=UPI0025ABA10B|nr:probable indole-3-pyruvate monooxygenase YUCCA11 [Salvia miltiorrhiza]